MAEKQKYSVNQHLIETILAWVVGKEIAIPEIQRPFVWDSTQVRDLMDSLYQGYPVGYLIAWRNPRVRLKDGTTSEGKKVLIDGQQRVAAMTAAILGHEVVNKEYKKVRITIAFNPKLERFEVLNPAIQKDIAWIQDIAPVVTQSVDALELIEDYCGKNHDADRKETFRRMDKLRGVVKKQVGLIELDADLDIDTVTEIFIRINSKGVVLSQADFVMSKIASDDAYGGAELRKIIDYFCHLVVAPEFHSVIKEGDPIFAATQEFRAVSWLKDENDDLFEPTYSDLLRVAFLTKFERGKLSDLVSLLSGRNFETRTFDEEIVQKSFRLLKEGVAEFVSETHFKRFLMIVQSTGLITTGLVRSQNVLNFSYAFYLKLREKGQPANETERLVRRWLIMSILTSRYTSSPESQFDEDIKLVASPSKDPTDVLAEIEAGELSEAFWDTVLPRAMDTSAVSSPYFGVFLAAQIKGHDKGFLSSDIEVRSLVEQRGDVHHVFPKKYLKKRGMGRREYNQIANFVYTQSEINIALGDKGPDEYMGKIVEQIKMGEPKIGNLRDEIELSENLKKNALPIDLHLYDASRYEEFLDGRRRAMAAKIRRYYRSL